MRLSLKLVAQAYHYKKKRVQNQRYFLNHCYKNNYFYYIKRVYALYQTDTILTFIQGYNKYIKDMPVLIF
jgi:hypothetical protein